MKQAQPVVQLDGLLGRQHMYPELVGKISHRSWPQRRLLRRSTSHETIEAEIDRIRSFGLDEVRALWRKTLRSSPPPAFSKDLVARFICWHIQEQAVGRLDPETTKLLGSLAQGDRPGADRPRRLRSGTVIVREYQGERHTVTVVPGGYVWRDATYASLSAIACSINGTAWNGPRFFGLRARGNRPENIEDEPAGSHGGIAAVGRLHRSSGSRPRTKVRR